jgi:hypothetical protein
MATNILRALINIKKVNDFYLPDIYSGKNRINNVGVALEYFVKDAFCDTFEVKDLVSKGNEYAKHFSYIGNANNPPDFILKGSDAVEVKKITNSNSGLALNSSYPKNKLYSDNPMITGACKNCEDWKEKDVIYSVGVVKDEKISALWFVYGDCYAADKEVYEKLSKKIIKSVATSDGIEFTKTRELGHINRVDPLGITYMRIRGMWGIENPAKVFSYFGAEELKEPYIIAIMTQEKFNSFPKEDQKELEKFGSIKNVEIKDPNNPAKFLKAKAIKL